MITSFIRLLCLMFLVCLPHMVFAQSVEKIVVTVNGVPLTSADLNQETQKIMPYYQGLHGGMTQEKQDKVRSEGMNKLIEMELSSQDARSKGITLSPADIRGEVNVLAQRFNTESEFKAAIKAAGFDEEGFSKFVERNVLAARAYKKEVLDKIVVTEPMIKEYYEKNAGKYSKPREYRASHILVKADPSASEAERQALQKKAESILKRLRDGGDFAAIASEVSDDLTRIKGGDIGYFHEGQALPEFEEVLQKMKSGEISNVIETIYGYHIIRLTDKREPRQMPLAELRDKIRADLAESDQKRLNDTWMSGLMKKASIVYPKR